MLNQTLIELPPLFPDFVAHRGMPVSDEALPEGILLPARLRNAVRSRQIEFFCGRRCAQQALEIVGANAADIPLGRDGSPTWPSGFVGSIAHTDRHAVAAVTRRSNALSLGIDVENLMPTRTAHQVAPLVTTSAEYHRLFNRPEDANTLTTILFSAKEAIFKCFYPLLQQKFDFTDVEIVSIDTVLGSFGFSFSKPPRSKRVPATSRFFGKMAIIDNVVHTGVLLPPMPDAGGTLSRNISIPAGERSGGMNGYNPIGQVDT